MVLIGPGEFGLIVASGASHDESASASSPQPATIEIFHNDGLVDRVHLGSGGTHSWWNTNPLLRHPMPGDKVKVVIDGPAAMRIDWPFSEQKPE